MDFSTVKGIAIPQGDVLRINDSNDNLLWKKHYFDFKDIKDILVSLGESTGTDEYGSYVTCTGRVVYRTQFTLLDASKTYNIYIKGYNTNTSQPTATNLGVNPSGVAQLLECSMSGTFTTVANAQSLFGSWDTQTTKIYDMYIDEDS